MTELVVTNVPDTWVNGSTGRTGTNYSSANQVQLKTGERRGFLYPDLGNIAGRTVLDAYLVGHAKDVDAQTITVAPMTSWKAPGRATWANQPTVGTGVATAISAAADGDVVELPGLAAIIQAFADGTDYYGFRITTNSATVQSFWATDSGQPAWELYVTLSDVADPPTGLRPDGGGDQGSTSPILAWDPVDGQTERRVQVDTPAALADPDEVAPDYDSGMAAGGDPEFDLTGEHTLSGAGPHYWRVQVETEGGMVPTWSDWAVFGYRAMPTFTLDSPTGAFGDITPQILGHMTGETLTWWKLQITGPDRSDVRASSRLQTGDMVWDVPERNKKGKRVLKENETDWLHVQAAGEYDRAVTVGQPGYFDEWYPLTLSDTDTVTPATGLSVYALAEGDPRLVWRVTRTEAATAYKFQVDGQTFARVDAEDVEASGGVYEWIDSGQVSPLRPHTLSVVVLESGEASEPVTVTDWSHIVEGVWLLPEDEEPIVLAGTAVGGFARADSVATYTTLPGDQVDVFYGHPGLADNFVGSVDSSDPDVWGTLDRIEALKAARNRQVRMVWGSHSMLVNLRDVTALAADDILPSNLLHNVRFGFVQVGE